MRQRCTILVLAAFVAATAPAAQEADDGPGLMERGFGMFLEGFRDEMSPALENMRRLSAEYGPALFSFLEEMGPALGEMLDQVKDWTAYDPPEMLPNGDIILRKKPDTETTPDSDPDRDIEPMPDLQSGPLEGQIDL